MNETKLEDGAFFPFKTPSGSSVSDNLLIIHVESAPLVIHAGISDNNACILAVPGGWFEVSE